MQVQICSQELDFLNFLNFCAVDASRIQRLKAQSTFKFFVTLFKTLAGKMVT